MAISTMLHREDEDFQQSGQSVRWVLPCAIKNSLRRNAFVLKCLATLMLGVTFCPVAAAAEGNIDRCNDILNGDLVNKVTRTTEMSQGEKQYVKDSVLRLGEDEAFRLYKQASESRDSQKTTGSGDAKFAGAGAVGAGAFDFLGSMDSTLSESEFKKAFNKAKEEYQRNFSSSSSREAREIERYRSTARDPNTVKAWEACMVKRSSEPELFAYGYRDESGSPYIAVVWVVPATYAASYPTINLQFVPTDADMIIDGAGANPQVAIGSGATYAIAFRGPNRKARSDGFVVPVNGKLMQGDKLVNTYRAEATVPRNLGPTSCELMITTSQQYELVVYSEKVRAFQKVGTLFLSGSEPTNQQGTVSYKGGMSIAVAAGNNSIKSSTPVHVTLTGSTLTITDDKRPNALPMTGECTGQEGVRVRFPTKFGAANLEWRIRPAQ